MKFLTVSLQALGICSAHQTLEPTSQLLVSLMEMYGEMGDKIALQYGGSEAHRKVPGGQVASSAKQSELLTSIKVSDIFCWCLLWPFAVLYVFKC
jgi:hypothetical protein